MKALDAADLATRGQAQPGWLAADPPRVAPGTLRETGIMGWAASAMANALARGGPVKPQAGAAILARNKGWFRVVLLAAVYLNVKAQAQGPDTHLTILRTCWNRGNQFEWEYHQALGRLAGVSKASCERVKVGPDALGWSPKQRSLLRAVDEMCVGTGLVSDVVWSEFAEHYDEREQINICFYVSLYVAIAMVMNNTGVKPEPGWFQTGPARFLSGEGSPLPRRIGLSLNRLLRPVAGKVGPWAQVTGGPTRSTVTPTPVAAFVADGRVVVPLWFGNDANWAAALLAQGEGRLEHKGRTFALTKPQIIDATSPIQVPLPARLWPRIADVLVAEISDRTPVEGTDDV